MGIVEEIVADFELSSGEEVQIEVNRNGKIHMHVDNVRIVFSPSEFYTLASIMEQGVEELQRIKGNEDDDDS